LKGIEASFQMVPLFLKSLHVWERYIPFLTFSQNTFSLKRDKACLTSQAVEDFLYSLAVKVSTYQSKGSKCETRPDPNIYFSDCQK
jgi:hypothetical protein